MNPFDLATAKAASGYWYLASPYSKYPEGFARAYRVVCEISAKLIVMGVPVYSPIAHSHPIAKWGNLDPFDYTIWLPLGAPMMNGAVGLIVAQMNGWRESYGVGVEITRFKELGRTIMYLDPASLT